MNIHTNIFLFDIFIYIFLSGHCLGANSGQNNQLVLIAFKRLFPNNHNKYICMFYVHIHRSKLRVAFNRPNQILLHFFLIGLLFGLLWLVAHICTHSHSVCVYVFGLLTMHYCFCFYQKCSFVFCLHSRSRAHTHTRAQLNRSSRHVFTV